jgi:hypothetical protein
MKGMEVVAPPRSIIVKLRGLGLARARALVKTKALPEVLFSPKGIEGCRLLLLPAFTALLLLYCCFTALLLLLRVLRMLL